MNLKKSQVAVEFLVTYGWAILGVMIVVGALAYFGVFNTDRFINDECNFGTQLYCEDFILQTGTPNMRFTFRNNFGQEIYLHSMNIYYEGKDLEFDDGGFDYDLQPGESVTLDGGNLKFITLQKKDKLKFNGLVVFRRATAGAPYHNVTGTIIATVQ